MFLVRGISKQNTPKTMPFPQPSSAVLSFIGSLMHKLNKIKRKFQNTMTTVGFTSRLDIEEGLAEEKKVRDTLNKELEALQKKAKIIDIGVKNAESELEAFQVLFHSFYLKGEVSEAYFTKNYAIKREGFVQLALRTSHPTMNYLINELIVINELLTRIKGCLHIPTPSPCPSEV